MEITSVGFWYYFICYTGLSVFMFYVFRHTLFDREPCGVYLRNAYDKISHICTHDAWYDYSTLRNYLTKLDYSNNAPSVNLNCSKYLCIIYSQYSEYMASLFVRQELHFDKSRAKLCTFDYFILTFVSFLEGYKFKEQLGNDYLLAGKTIDLGGYKYYSKHEEDEYYELSDFGKTYYSLLYQGYYYLHYQDERICKKKKWVKTLINIPDYTNTLKTIKEILETNKIKKDWIR